MSVFPDVNVLVALAWPNHVHHQSASAWFLGAAEQGWATTPVTESGFIRVSSNRKVIAQARSPKEAVDVLGALRLVGNHQFLADEITFCEGAPKELATITGYRQVTDLHLLALARRHQVELVTFDSGIAQLGDPGEVLLLSL